VIVDISSVSSHTQPSLLIDFALEGTTCLKEYDAAVSCTKEATHSFAASHTRCSQTNCITCSLSTYFCLHPTIAATPTCNPTIKQKASCFLPCALKCDMCMVTRTTKPGSHVGDLAMPHDLNSRVDVHIVVFLVCQQVTATKNCH
jgi:hypothetical protein